MGTVRRDRARPRRRRAADGRGRPPGRPVPLRRQSQLYDAVGAAAARARAGRADRVVGARPHRDETTVSQRSPAPRWRRCSSRAAPDSAVHRPDRGRVLLAVDRPERQPTATRWSTTCVIGTGRGRGTPSRRRPRRRRARRRTSGPATQRGFGQVGCIYTAQGFEYDWSGVIFGHDFVWRDDRWVAAPRALLRHAVKKADGRRVRPPDPQHVQGAADPGHEGDRRVLDRSGDAGVPRANGLLRSAPSPSAFDGRTQTSGALRSITAFRSRRRTGWRVRRGRRHSPARGRAIAMSRFAGRSPPAASCARWWRHRGSLSRR